MFYCIKIGENGLEKLFTLIKEAKSMLSNQQDHKRLLGKVLRSTRQCLNQSKLQSILKNKIPSSYQMQKKAIHFVEFIHSLERTCRLSRVFSFQFCNLENLVRYSKNLAKLVQKNYTRKRKLVKKMTNVLGKKKKKTHHHHHHHDVSID